jgi:hypothetical protein
VAYLDDDVKAFVRSEDVSDLNTLIVFDYLHDICVRNVVDMLVSG